MDKFVPLRIRGRETGIPLEEVCATMVNIRHMDISCAESPFVTLNLDYSGPCDLRCPDCHSRSLWEAGQGDCKLLGKIMERIEKLVESGLINGLCVLGTDGDHKAVSVRILIDLASKLNVPSIVFTGHGIDTARGKYGLPDFFVCGPYLEGEWHTNKRFYKLVGEPGYAEITKEQYFNSR